MLRKEQECSQEVRGGKTSAPYPHTDSGRGYHGMARTKRPLTLKKGQPQRNGSLTSITLLINNAEL